MEPVEKRYDTIQSLANQLVNEMKLLKKDVDDARNIEQHCDNQLTDIKQFISFFKTHASESSRIAKKMEELRKERRIAKDAIALYDTLALTLSDTSHELRKMEATINEKRTKKPTYRFRSKEVFGFLDEIQQAESRSRANHILPESLAKHESTEPTLEVLKNTSPVYKISHVKSGKRTIWKLQNTFTKVYVHESAGFTSLLQAMDMYNCTNLEFAPTSKQAFIQSIKSSNNGVFDENTRRIAHRYYYELTGN